MVGGAAGQRVLAALYAFFGAGWAAGTLAVLAYHDQRGELPMTPFGFRLLGSSLPEIGTERLTALGQVLAWALIGISALDVVAGRWLWHGRRRGAVLALALAPASCLLAVLFELPLLIILAPLRAIWVLLSWRDLRA